LFETEKKLARFARTSVVTARNITDYRLSLALSTNCIHLRHRKLAKRRVKKTTNITTLLRPFFPDYSGEPVPEENFCTLWCKGRLTEADTTTIRLGATPSALPAAQPTASKH